MDLSIVDLRLFVPSSSWDKSSLASLDISNLPPQRSSVICGERVEFYLLAHVGSIHAAREFFDSLHITVDASSNKYAEDNSDDTQRKSSSTVLMTMNEDLSKSPKKSSKTFRSSASPTLSPSSSITILGKPAKVVESIICEDRILSSFTVLSGVTEVDSQGPAAIVKAGWAAYPLFVRFNLPTTTDLLDEFSLSILVSINQRSSSASRDSGNLTGTKAAKQLQLKQAVSELLKELPPAAGPGSEQQSQPNVVSSSKASRHRYLMRQLTAIPAISARMKTIKTNDNRAYVTIELENKIASAYRSMASSPSKESREQIVSRERSSSLSVQNANLLQIGNSRVDSTATVTAATTAATAGSMSRARASTLT